MSLCKTCLHGDLARVSPMDFSEKEVCHACVFLDDEQTRASNWRPQTMTNADRIRAMSDEELARFAADRQANETYVSLTAARYKPSPGLFNATREILYAKYLYWLRQPVKDGDNDVD